jgi:hypothetical protein
MEHLNAKMYYQLLNEGKIPDHGFVNEREVYLKNRKWYYKDNNGFAKNPFIFRCQICGNVVRNSSNEYCPKHMDWSKKSHGSSILIDTDIKFLAENVNVLNDIAITKILLTKDEHKIHTQKSLLYAIRHHRRKYLLNRYTGKFFYKTIESDYKNLHKECEVCKWKEGSVDVHHIWQLRDFENELDYYDTKNLICLCPNHHRVLEEMRKENKEKYILYIQKYHVAG